MEEDHADRWVDQHMSSDRPMASTRIKRKEHCLSDNVNIRNCILNMETFPFIPKDKGRTKKRLDAKCSCSAFDVII